MKSIKSFFLLYLIVQLIAVSVAGRSREENDYDGDLESAIRQVNERSDLWKAEEESPLNARQTAGNSEQEAANVDDIESTNKRLIARPICPPGFTNTVDGFPKCYAIIKQPLTWAEAQSRCGQLNTGAHLAIFTNVLENQVVSEILRNHDCYQDLVYPDTKHRQSEFWLGGQRMNANDCKTSFVWKLPAGGYLKQSYDNWMPGEPDCFLGIESCMSIRKTERYGPLWQWNDLLCTVKTCAVCEVMKHIQI